MHPVVEPVAGELTPESLVNQLTGEPGVVLLRSLPPGRPGARYSIVAARPFLSFRSFGSRCELSGPAGHGVLFGDPWRLLDSLISRYELPFEPDLPFPAGGCFGYWGYDLKNFVEPKLRRRAAPDLELPDCHLGFYASLVICDHLLGQIFILANGLDFSGSRDRARAQEQVDFWRQRIEAAAQARAVPESGARSQPPSGAAQLPTSNLCRDEFISRVRTAQRFIHHGDIYQVNLSHRLAAPCSASGWDFYKNLSAVSPAPYSAWLDCGGFQIASSSPEQFLRLSGAAIQTCPIKGTRPRATDPNVDAQLGYELLTSDKERAELLMITDLLRNDLGKICEFGSVAVPELLRLERFAHVQHLVSTVEGRLRDGVTHTAALQSCFPGGSVTGAPKFRAMEIIDELEPFARGPYTGALGYIGFNRESQLSIIIRAAICLGDSIYFQTGAGIVADSDPAAEYEETLAKARGFLQALRPGVPEGAPGGCMAA